MSQNLEQTVEKILFAVVSLQSDVADIKTDLTNTKKIVDQTFTRIDSFLSIIDRHEAEIAALRSAYNRLEQRILTLEAH